MIIDNWYWNTQIIDGNRQYQTLILLQLAISCPKFVSLLTSYYWDSLGLHGLHGTAPEDYFWYCGKPNARNNYHLAICGCFFLQPIHGNIGDSLWHCMALGISHRPNTTINATLDISRYFLNLSLWWNWNWTCPRYSQCATHLQWFEDLW
jgi:hypothetical protein